MKILVIQKKRIGDVLVSTIIFEALRKKFPKAELHYLVYSMSLAVVENNPFIDKLIILDNKTKKSLWKMMQFLYKLRKQNYDVVVDAYGKPNSVLMGWFSGAKKTITFDKKYSKLLYSDVIHRRENPITNATLAIEHRMQLLEPLGIDFASYQPKIFLNDSEIEEAKKYLISNGINLEIPIVMISAIGSKESKTYPLEYMAAILNEIATKNVQILMNYIPFQKELAEELYGLCNAETQSKIFMDVYENDLRKFIAITSQCKALIGNEGGATHMAKSVKVPTFIIFAIGIIKESWSIYENETTDVAISILDYFPGDDSDFETLTKKFKPALFLDKLKKFLEFNIK
ncbi:MAG: glycosyltransferase family 9 protein [Flavobacterium sp.]|nr:glycosyltransferase family 9 protein [Flavobacterium sp.]